MRVLGQGRGLSTFKFSSGEASQQLNSSRSDLSSEMWLAMKRAPRCLSRCRFGHTFGRALRAFPETTGDFMGDGTPSSVPKLHTFHLFQVQLGSRSPPFTVRRIRMWQLVACGNHVSSIFIEVLLFGFDFVFRD